MHFLTNLEWFKDVWDIGEVKIGLEGEKVEKNDFYPPKCGLRILATSTLAKLLDYQTLISCYLYFLTLWCVVID